MLTELRYELFRGFAYRKISHPEMHRYTRLFPLILYALALVFYFVLPVKPIWLGKEGALSSLLSILATLPGFYFAGLAAVSTFGATTMDVTMPEPTPTIRMRVRGKYVEIPLSRRQFLCYLFSYLVIVSFMLCFILLSFSLLFGTISAVKMNLMQIMWGSQLWAFVKFTVLSFVGLSFFSMLVTTLHGLYFLTERMHTPP